MSLSVLNTGVTNGVAVANQNTGVSLNLIGDYGYIQVGANAPTQGPDSQGAVTISGTFPACVVAFEKVVTVADFAAANWTALQGVMPRSTGLALGSNLVSLLASTGGDFTLPSVQGWYAVRVRLVATLASGAVVVSGTTFPVTAGVAAPAVLAAYTALTTTMLAVALGLSDLNNTDYMAAAVGASYP